MIRRRIMQRRLQIYFGGGTKPNFIDFIRVDKFDSVADSYLMNLVNGMKSM